MNYNNFMKRTSNKSEKCEHEYEIDKTEECIETSVKNEIVSHCKCTLCGGKAFGRYLTNDDGEFLELLKVQEK